MPDIDQLPGPKDPSSQLELVARLDHAVFGVGDETGLLYQVRSLNGKLDRLTLAIVGSAMTITITLLVATVTFFLTYTGK